MAKQRIETVGSAQKSQNNEKNEGKESELKNKPHVKSLSPPIEENIDMKGGKLYLKVLDTISKGTDISSGSTDLSGCGYKSGMFFGETFKEFNNMIATDTEIGFMVNHINVQQILNHHMII